MTSISQQSQAPCKTQSASILTSSYSSAAKKAVSSPPVAAGSSPQSAIVATGISGPVQPNNGKSSSSMPINGKHSISPAVPVVSAPSIAYSNSIVNGAPNNNRKPSMTISANSRNSMNGGPVGGSNGKIQFGSITDSPAPSHSTPQIFQPAVSAPIPIANPRVSDPSHSPSPIPQPSASGGRPPVVGPGSGVNFGSFGGDSDRHVRQAAGPPPSAPCTQQNSHSRHDSSQSVQSDMSNQQGRGYPHQNNRGRGGFQNQYSQPQMGGYPPPNNSFRNAQGQGRGGISPFQSQGRPPFPNSPLQSSRSPAIPSSSMPGTPNMNPSMPMPSQQQYPGPYYPQHIAGPQYNYPTNYDTRSMLMQGAYLYPQIQNMGYIPGIPQSPQTGFQQPHYTPGQYAPQAQQMSRTSSQISDQQPASNMGQPRTPSISSIVHPLTPQLKNNASIPAPFTRPIRKSAAIIIKRPDGEAVDIESFKAPASPAPSARARTPPIIASNPVLPPKPTHIDSAGDDSPGIKTPDQIKKEIIEKVQKSAHADNKPSSNLATPTEQPKSLPPDVDVKAFPKDISDGKPDGENKTMTETSNQPCLNDEDDIERQIAEIEAAEAESARKEAEILQKRDAERAKAKAEEERLQEIAKREESQKLREQELEMERLEDERERKRAEAEANSAGASQVKSVQDLLNETSSKDQSQLPIKKAAPTPILMTPIANVTASVTTSDELMGPPPKVNATDKRLNKPSALNLTPLSGKPIEPPQPSAALKSLKSARFLTVLDPSMYPSPIHSPNPALNQAVKNKGKSFKYDKEFLLQFQKVFVEKPSMEFESQIKALIGDSDTGVTRSGSTRAAENMAARSNSNRNSAQGAFNMGSFASTTSGKSLAPGATSEQRYAMSGSSISRPQINSMAPYIRSRSNVFPAGNTVVRNPSNPGMPHSPRQQSRRGNASNKGYNNSNSKQDAQAAKTMPLTAGADVKPIQISATGWKPRSIVSSQSGPVPGASVHMDPDMVQRKVKAALNKMTPEKFDKIADQILSIAAQSKDEADGRTLRQVIQLTFEKATDEAHWASMYAKFCKRMLETMSPEIKDETILDKNGEVVSGGNLFRKYLLNRCQEEFERGWKIDLPEKPKGDSGEETSEEAVMLSDEYYLAATAKRRGLGLVQFIGELYKLSMLTERIMHQCVKKLVDHTGIPDEAEIESLTKLLKTIGANLDSTDKGKQVMDAYFNRIKIMIGTPDLPSRLRFMLMDIVDLREKGWASKESNKGPKTLDEVRAEAEQAAAQKAAENARSNQRGGGGNRISMGRGDSRSFSNQYGNQPPLDLHRNTITTDDLRRLTNKNSNPRASSHQMTFGPSSMFASRSSSGRKMGPGGSFNRLGEESGVSSRTGTPPQQKEKESTTSANSYSLLAGLGSGEVEHPASPPSTSASPASSKATPAIAEKSD